jgi:hypothetical protein
MTVEVVMLDLTDMTLHKPSPVHQTSMCGILLDPVTVGPRSVLYTKAERYCPACWPPTAHLWGLSD